MAATKADDRAGRELSEAGRDKLQSLAAALRVTPDVLPAAPGGAILADLVHRMDRHDNDREAPVREVMSRLGDRWSTLILLVLSAGTFRHATLRRLIATMSAERAISQRMLTLRLRALERDGMVARTVTPTVPPRVDYALTPLGRNFVALIDSVLKWIERHDAAIQQSRERFEAEAR
jgi:DNA-binding HxlR family transcriptional regulator